MDLQKDYQLFVDLWRLFRHFRSERIDDACAKELVDQVGSFAGQHGNTRFSKELAQAVMWELDRLATEGKD